MALVVVNLTESRRGSRRWRFRVSEVGVSVRQHLNDQIDCSANTLAIAIHLYNTRTTPLQSVLSHRICITGSEPPSWSAISLHNIIVDRASGSSHLVARDVGNTIGLTMAEQAFNIPQIIAVLLVGFLAVRWFFSSSSNQATSSRNGGRQVNPAHVEQVLQMFPQLDRRTIMWDLQRNGGSVQATTERVLAGRGLAEVKYHLSGSPTA